jgi:hypothetical protein
MRRNDDLRRIRDKILPNNQAITKSLKLYQRAVSATFDENYEPQCNHLLELQRFVPFKYWNEREQSSVLLLRGEASRMTHFCWFSPILLQYVESLRQTKEIVAFHCCQIKDSSDPGDGFSTVLANLALQLLEAEPQILTQHSSAKSILSKFEDRGRKEDDQLAQDVLIELLRALEKVTLVVDRVDMMCGKWEEGVTKLSALAKPKIARKCLVKLVLIGSRSTKVWEDLCGELVEEVGERAFFQLRKDQDN